MLIIKQAVFDEEGNLMGFAVLKNNTLKICPVCGIGNIYNNVNSGNSECTNNPPCEFSVLPDFIDDSPDINE